MRKLMDGELFRSEVGVTFRSNAPRSVRAHRGTLVFVAAVVAALASAMLGDQAAAGVYTVYTCDAQPPDGKTIPVSDDTFVNAFPEQKPFAFATRGMFSTRAGRRCRSGTKRELRGLVSMNYYPRGGTVPKGTRARYEVHAPPGTHFASLKWAGSVRRKDCRWTAQIYTRGPRRDKAPTQGDASIRNRRGVMKDCRGKLQGQASQTVNLHLIPKAAGATRFVQRVFCAGNERSDRCSNRAPNYARTQAMEFVVADSTPPGVGIVADTPFTRGAWVSSQDQAVNYNAADNVGVKSVQATVNGAVRGLGHDRDCDFRGRGGLVPCPNGPGTVKVLTDRLVEGTQTLGLVATDSANNSSVSTNAVTVRVDKTAPGAVPVGVAGGEGWRSANDFHLTWQNPPEVDRAPIVGASYRLCPVAGGECVAGSRTGLGIAGIHNLGVPSAGEWRFQMWRTDAAGNEQPENRSQPVVLRFDPEAPQLGFEAVSAEDPTKLAAQVIDKVSGLAGGQIEISRQGSGSWQQLPTQVEGSRLVARVDDARLPGGVYQVRAFARDHAGNQGASDRRLDGQPMTIQVPLRVQTALRAGVARKRSKVKRIRRGGKRRRVRRRVTVLRSRARVRFGRRVGIVGRLTSSDGTPLTGAPVRVYSRTAAGPERLVGTVTTGHQGRYRYRTRARATRTLRFVYAGSGRSLPAERRVSLLVPAASTFMVSPRRAVNGQAVRFRGRLRAPAASKLVELQVVLSGRWQTFRTVRTGPRGRWSARYRFRRTCGLARYRFRARLPEEASYPFETGRTRAVGVTVRGRRCR